MAFFNTPAQVQQFQNFTPQQQNALDQLLSMGLGKVNNQQQFDFAPIEQKARTEFQTNTIPTIAERFTSMGNGAQRSSAFQGALGNAASGLEQSLAALRSQYGLQQQGMQSQLGQNLLQLGLGQQFDTLHQPEQRGFLSTAGGSILSLLPLLALGAGTGGLGLGALGGLGGLGLLGGLLGSYNGGQQ